MNTPRIGDYAAREVALTPEIAEWQMSTRFRGRQLSERVESHVLFELAADSRQRELWDELASLECPLLVARPGTDDGVINDEVLALYREARPDVEVVTVPEAPHDLFRPDRTFYPRAVLDFIDRRCPGD